MSVIIGSRKDRTVSGAIAALAGKPTTLTPGAAIAILAEAAAAGPEKVAGRRATSALAKVVTDHAEPQVRVAAAKGLSHVQSDVSVRALRKVADHGADGQLLAAAAAGLTNLGGRADVKRLRGAAVRADWPLAAAQAAASARLLGAPRRRHARPGGRDPAAPGRGRAGAAGRRTARRRGSRRSTCRWPGAEGRRRTCRGPPSCPRAPRPSGRSAAATAPTWCWPARTSRSLATAPGSPGTLLGVNESMGTTFVRWVVLTRPDGDGLAVTVARPTGEVGFVGRGSIVDGVLSVTVDAVDHPGATAVHVTASLSGGTLEVDGRSEKTITSPAAPAGADPAAVRPVRAGPGRLSCPSNVAPGRRSAASRERLGRMPSEHRPHRVTTGTRPRPRAPAGDASSRAARGPGLAGHRARGAAGVVPARLDGPRRDHQHGAVLRRDRLARPLPRVRHGRPDRAGARRAAARARPAGRVAVGTAPARRCPPCCWSRWGLSMLGEAGDPAEVRLRPRGRGGTTPSRTSPGSTGSPRRRSSSVIAAGGVAAASATDRHTGQSVGGAHSAQRTT